MPKLLGEFLQEQQEPFTLEVYLLERGYARCSLKTRRRQAIPNCSELVRAVFSRILLHKIKNPRKNDDTNHEDEFSSTTFYSSCSDVEDERSMEEDCDKQLSPISVLEETESEASPLHQRQYKFKKAKGESSKSISQRRSKHKTAPKFQECMEHSQDYQYTINKRALQQTKKLLVDCVREVIENEGGGGKQLKKILGAEELWKAVCENVWLWSQESIHENNISHIVRCDFMASLGEWGFDSHQHKDEVSMEVGDAILEDIINEIISCQ
ncbi:acetylglutamate kinase [Salvia divinorum]|uniref:Acetylglutamate kinase n=1 Tax=Salvia divinorum TaxID=28513 RepID=A0ABD1GRV5_SALDI